MPTRVRRRIVHQRAKGPIDPAFGERVRRLRTQRGLTQAQLAGSDFTKAFISHIEHGRTRVSMRAAGILAARLSVDVRELMALSGNSDLQQELSLVLAESHLVRGDPAAALEALRGLRPTINSYGARAQRLEGLAHLAVGHPREAIGPLTESIRLFKLDSYAESAARATYDLAYAYASLDQPAESVGLLLDSERALATAEVVDRTLELKVQALLAGALMRMGDNASADLHAARAAAIAEDVVDEDALDTLYASLVTLKREQGDLEMALRYARKALQLHERAGRQSDAIFAWDNLAWIYIEREQYDRADDALERAERLRRTASSSVSRHLGHLIVTRAKLELARGNAQEALHQGRDAMADAGLARSGRAQASVIVARALVATDAPLVKVRDAFEDALKLYEAEPAQRRARVHEAYAEALAARKRTDEAYQQAQRALKLQRM